MTQSYQNRLGDPMESLAGTALVHCDGKDCEVIVRIDVEELEAQDKHYCRACIAERRNEMCESEPRKR